MTTARLTSGLTERTWPSVIQSPISVNGHIVTVGSTYGLKVKMTVTLSKFGLESQQFEIKRVFDSTTLMVGPIGKNIKKTSDAVQFDGGTLYASEQSRNKLGDSPIIRAVYEEEPAIAIRTIGVSQSGAATTTPQGMIDIFEPDATFIYGPALECVQIREYVPSDKRYNGQITLSIDGYVILDDYQPWMQVGCPFIFLRRLPTGEIDPNEEQYEITGKNEPLTIKDVTNRNMTFNNTLNRISFVSPTPDWMQPGRWFKVEGGLNDGLILVVTNAFSNYIEVNGPVVNDTGTFKLDGRLSLLELNPAPTANFDGTGLIDGSLGEQVKVTNLNYGPAYEVTQIYITSDEVQAIDIIRDDR